MTSWVYLTYPPREQFAATMTEEERAIFSEHFAYLTRLLESEMSKRPGYREYMERTSMFLPLPPKRQGSRSRERG